jgi:hypothetical protein
VRELLEGPLRLLAYFLAVAACFTLVGFEAAADGVPRAIGHLSDYGNVLDRHGRDRIESRIADAWQRFSLDVYVLASWEDPFDDPNRFAIAVQESWGLDAGRTLLAVFLLSHDDWSVRVLPGRVTMAGAPSLAVSLENGIRDLVAHRRIEEAMVALFDEIHVALGVGESAGARSGVGSSRIGAILILGAAIVSAVLFITRRPRIPARFRCGILLPQLRLQETAQGRGLGNRGGFRTAELLRKVRTPQGRPLGKSQRGRLRESATENRPPMARRCGDGHW